MFCKFFKNGPFALGRRHGCSSSVSHMTSVSSLAILLPSPEAHGSDCPKQCARRPWTTLNVTVAKLSRCYRSADCQIDSVGGFCRVDFKNITIQITFPGVPMGEYGFDLCFKLNFRTFVEAIPCGTTGVIRSF